MKTETKAELRISVIERPLSDQSKVYSVVIRESGGMPFIELDCITEKKARALRDDICDSIRRNTNITVDDWQ